MGGKGSGRKPYGKKVVVKTTQRRIGISEVERKRRQAKRQWERRAAQKAIVNAWKLNQGYCYDCGWEITEERLQAIDCDHVNPDDKAYDISEQCGAIPNHLLMPELNKCQARCRNCHAMRTHREGHAYNNNKSKPTVKDDDNRLFDVS